MKSISEISQIRAILRWLNRNRRHDDLDDVELFRVMICCRLQRLYCRERKLRQDILVAVLARFKRNGYFVEFGATDGVYLSNTFLLEQQLGWTGILAEPARV